MARDRQVRTDDHAPGAVERHAQGLAERAGLDAGRPEDVAHRDELVADGDALRRDVGHDRVQAHLDAHALQVALGTGAQLRRERRQHAVRPLEEDDAGRPRVDVPVVLREGLPGDLLDRAGEFDAGRAGADDPERQGRAARRFVAFVLGRLEGQEDAPPQLRGVLDALQARRDRGPLVVPEVGVRRPGRQDEVVVPNVAARQRSGAGRRRPRR